MCFHPDYCHFITSSLGWLGLFHPLSCPHRHNLTVCQRFSLKSLLVISQWRLQATIQDQKLLIVNNTGLAQIWAMVNKTVLYCSCDFFLKVVLQQHISKALWELTWRTLDQKHFEFRSRKQTKPFQHLNSILFEWLTTIKGLGFVILGDILLASKALSSHNLTSCILGWEVRPEAALFSEL